ncbi:MAG: insecticidal toxin complex protein, partial [Deltaproteobacteria bacterium]|nr:insecticidal toxin complex protein [Deltaproteobacteria bacterium]
MNSNDEKKAFPQQETPLFKINATESNAIEIPQINLPKGGGALKGIDEKFTVNAANGTATLNIPLPITPGRNTFAPSLTLSYNSGGGNSIFGIGWNADPPCISRKTDNRIPTYDDEKDIFLFSGVEDLVPLLNETNAGWKTDSFTHGEYRVKRYRPRIEGAYARIEKIYHHATGSYWKVTTADNVATIFGRSAAARIADPEEPNRVFKWLPELAYDGKGNWIQYEYKSEDLSNVPFQLHENNRIKGVAAFANTYLKRVKYGNHQPYFADPLLPYDPPVPQDQAHFFELVFDFGEHHETNPKVTEAPGLSWPARIDSFSWYKAGFEIRTYRLCRRILMFHHFEELGSAPCLVKSLDVGYQSASQESSLPLEVTYLQSLTHRGWLQKTDGSYSVKSLPPIELDYQELAWDTRIREADPQSLANAPTGLSGDYSWVDLFGEGISGILKESDREWYYKSNLGSSVDGSPSFSVAMPVLSKPSFSGFSDGSLQIQDLDADGKKQIVVHTADMRGYFELDRDASAFAPFRPFEQTPNIDFQDSNVRHIDLNGDGQPELVISEDNVFIWYPSKGVKGYDGPMTTAKPFDEESGPAIVFSNNTESIFLADMTGDGLTDIVRIRNGEVCYWPNTGYGRFAPKVNMSNAPLLDTPDLFNTSFLHLADISGTGTTDIIYIGKNICRAWLNCCGNFWSAPVDIETFIQSSPPNQLDVIDLLGTGTSCIVWSSPLPANEGASLKYIDLMGGKKPHLLRKYINNLGMEKTLHYRSSVHYYLADKNNGTPWITRLPFPVQCVDHIEVLDRISNQRFASEYSYHHGYYDYPEKEFRGFGMVEQLDTEEYEHWVKNQQTTNQALEAAIFQPPMLTKTWYHVGAFLDEYKILDQFEKEYWYHNPELIDLLNAGGPSGAISEPALPPAQLTAAQNVTPANINKLSADEWREALRACKGMALRQEVFALDAGSGSTPEEKIRALTPYSVATHNCRINLLQPRQNNDYAVFSVLESESLAISYERDRTDPRIAHSFNLRVDELGKVLDAAHVVYPRISADLSLDQQMQEAQARTWITYTRDAFSNDVIFDSIYRLRQPVSSKTYEITGLTKTGDLYAASDFQAVIDGVVTEIPYHEKAAGPNVEIRRIEQVTTLFFNDELVGPLPFGTLNTTGIIFENYQLAYTPELIQKIYGGRVSTAMMAAAGYVDFQNDGNWWIRSGHPWFIDMSLGENSVAARNRFYVPIAYEDPHGTVTKTTYYKNYYLLPDSLTDALGNRTAALAFNFRTLGPQKVKDMNDNLSGVVVDELGLVKAMAVMGKDKNNDGIGEEGDHLSGHADHVEQAEPGLIDAFLQTDDYALQTIHARDLLKSATARFVYDLDRYKLSGKPVVAATISREMHAVQETTTNLSKLQFAFEYSDGMGRVAMKKAQAEPGKAKKVVYTNDTDYTVVELDTRLLPDAPIRWIGNGRTIVNNKGNPVKQYEPYFSGSHHYENLKDLVETGVTAIMYYDPPGRLIRTEMPDETHTKVLFDAWTQTTYDANDTSLSSPWSTKRLSQTMDAELLAEGKDPIKEKEAASKAIVHADTPAIVYLDTLGRPVMTVADNGASGRYRTFIAIDSEGNVRHVWDSRQNPVMEYDYDMLGHRVYENSMDAGERWMFNDVTGKPSRSWDGRGHMFSFEYDLLQRPLTSTVSISGGTPRIFARVEYGESLPDAKQRNLRGQTYQTFDTSGRSATVAMDFKGNVISGEKQLLQDYSAEVDWGQNPSLESDIFTTHSKFDALNRVTESTMPAVTIASASKLVPQYNQASLLETLDIYLNGSNTATRFVENIDYDEKGRRESSRYGNQSTTRYFYDKNTFRLIRLLTARNNETEILQDLRYTYDPVGNITNITDAAQQILYYNNQVVPPSSDYTYDAIYRLKSASGREHIGQNMAPSPWDTERTNLPHKGDGGALQRYEESYSYDEAGNILKMIHRAGNGALTDRWTRTSEYEPANNRLKTTRVGNPQTPDTFTYDVHGNMTSMPHLQAMAWDAMDRLMRIQKGTQIIYYQYDGSGQRTRKVVEKQNGQLEERLYLGGFEIYRKYQTATVTLERETLHVADDQGRIALVETRTLGSDAVPR